MSEANLQRYLTSRHAAAQLGYTVQHTRLLIRNGKLEAAKFGRDWLVARESVAQYQMTVWEDNAPPKVTLTLGKVVNVASVPQRSPFRYPGGKTWLVPYVRAWLSNRQARFTDLVEPFAGGGIVSLTAVFEGLVDRAILVELDADVASVWETLLNGDAKWLAEQIAGFDLSRQCIEVALAESGKSTKHRAFATILRNRINRGGILAPGAGRVKNGENGRGLRSRWYPETLRRRIRDIAQLRNKLSFIRGDGLQILQKNAGRSKTAFFIDPPYTVAGRRLYAHSDIDHEELFRITGSLGGSFLMTYDDAAEIRRLVQRHRYPFTRVPMKSTHHEKKMELLITDRLDWLQS